MKPIGIISSYVPATSIRKWPFSEGGTSSEGSRGGGEDLVRLSLQDAGGNPEKKTGHLELDPRPKHQIGK